MKNLSEYAFEKDQLLLIDKPWGWTSFKVVKIIRKKIRNFLGKNLKIGHAGTLDPLATGLLIILIGREYTKKTDSIQNYKKTYTGIIKLGCTTQSFDSETEEYNFSSTSHITPELVQEISKKFKGEIDQIPPSFSALRMEGKRFYEYARKGKKINSMKPRKVKIYKFYILKIGIPYIQFFVECGKGTYIRSIAKDFGIAMKSGAYLLSLRRESIGPFSIRNSYSIDF
ncbi:tRNA pseudouridine synthase B [Blattabacterium sp. (Blatta orientalis) str. Tarazona]|uniref:tRNA pseudouridine(55) synthase TruB n=1 Tax=Blattabacterium sp. (Blatta orientalis) TaxID=367806 RepID=UPI0002AD94FF|nr:tRNA pseudouridine(55) synthase TruB [Blattabacterium sp. (Blatta orientalis)]AGD98243.1 tRNA pseudouridine synthase B [Blattabacterium sp. (Blatta orientalis) str. Tarazona]